jgi:aminopeptidase N
MSLYSRESLIEHLKNLSDFIFEVTIESMKLYEELFGYPYPYFKYDSVFCPEYNMGAMGKLI